MTTGTKVLLLLTIGEELSNLLLICNKPNIELMKTLLNQRGDLKKAVEEINTKRNASDGWAKCKN